MSIAAAMDAGDGMKQNWPLQLRLMKADIWTLAAAKAEEDDAAANPCDNTTIKNSHCQ